jgi:hypothetical protein
MVGAGLGPGTIRRMVAKVGRGYPLTEETLLVRPREKLSRVLGGFGTDGFPLNIG